MDAETFFGWIATESSALAPRDNFSANTERRALWRAHAMTQFYRAW